MKNEKGKMKTVEGGNEGVRESDTEEYEFLDEDGNRVKIMKITKEDGGTIHVEEIKEKNAKKIKVTVNEETMQKEEGNQRE